MPYLIRVLSFADGSPCPVAGEYLQSFDFDANDGQGQGVFTANPDRAKQFPTFTAAGNFWKTRSKVRPTRPDGKPNRPLTASSVEIVRMLQET